MFALSRDAIDSSLGKEDFAPFTYAVNTSKYWNGLLLTGFWKMIKILCYARTKVSHTLVGSYSRLSSISELWFDTAFRLWRKHCITHHIILRNFKLKTFAWNHCLTKETNSSIVIRSSLWKPFAFPPRYCLPSKLRYRGINSWVLLACLFLRHTFR